MEGPVLSYKFLRADGTSVFSGVGRPLAAGGPRPWIVARVDPWHSGSHACRPPAMPYWVGRTLYEIELDGEIVAQRAKLVAPRGRLLRPVDAWDDATRDDYTRT